MTLPLFPAKRGDNFELAGELTMPEGDYSVRCQARRPGSTGVWELTVTLGDCVDGVAAIAIEAAPAITRDWAPGRLESDIKIVDLDTGRTVHTEKFGVDVADVVTA